LKNEPRVIKFLCALVFAA